MSGRYRAKGKTTELLDKVFGNRRRSLGIALLAAGAVYLVAIVFGNNPYLLNAILRPPVMGLTAFIGAFVVLGIGLILPFVSPKVMDLLELLAICGCAVLLVRFVLLGIWQCDAAVAFAQAAGIWCADCVIHKIRE